MTGFLTLNQVGTTIRRVVKGGKPRCAVAFWGSASGGALFEGGLPPGARIICDLTMGGTNPAELVRLGAPKNPELRHVQRLHAKVFLSDRGVVIGSANASGNGLGYAADGGLVEACVFYPPTDEVFRQAARWFERLWKQSLQVDHAALETARASWREHPRRLNIGRTINPASVLDTLLSAPDRFRGIGVVFSHGTASARQRNAAAQNIIDETERKTKLTLDDAESSELRDWPLVDVFSGWSPEDILAWPKRFICVNRNRQGRIDYWFYERDYTTVIEDDEGEETCGIVLAERPKFLARKLGFKQSLRKLADIDQDQLQRVMAAIVDEARLFENISLLANFVSELDT